MNRTLVSRSFQASGNDAILSRQMRYAKKKIKTDRAVVVAELQCDQIGRIFKVLGDKLYYKSIPNIWGPSGIMLKTSLLENLGYFLSEHLVTLGRAFGSRGFKSSHGQIYMQHLYTVGCRKIKLKQRSI